LWLPRTTAAAVIDKHLDGADRVFRRVWHKIMFGQSVVLNNAFGFFLQAVLDGSGVVRWNSQWCVTHIYSLAGSCSGAHVARRFSPQERVILTKDGGATSPHEATWIVLMLQDERDDGNHAQRFIHCSVSSCDLHQNVFVQPWLPFFVIEPLPSASPQLVALLINERRLAKEIIEYRIGASVLSIAQHSYNPPASRLAAQNGCCNTTLVYQIDMLRELQPIPCRVFELFQCLTETTDAVVLLRRDLLYRCTEIRDDKKKSKATRAQEVAQLEAFTTERCLHLEHLRNNSVSLFILLQQVQKFYGERAPPHEPKEIE